MSLQHSIHLQQLTSGITVPASIHRHIYSNSISYSRAWKLQKQQTMATSQSAAAAAAGGQHTIDWQAYNARWQDIWQGGLQKGQVRVVVKQLLLTADALRDVLRHVGVPALGWSGLGPSWSTLEPGIVEFRHPGCPRCPAGPAKPCVLYLNMYETICLLSGPKPSI
jgi:hypothetical protein